MSEKLLKRKENSQDKLEERLQRYIVFESILQTIMDNPSEIIRYIGNYQRKIEKLKEHINYE